MIRSNPERTQERIRRLQEYMHSHVLADGKFLCHHFAECRESRAAFPFYEGQLSHVGKLYDLEIDARPVRIVIAAQEYGTGERNHGLMQRTQMIADSAQVGFRGRNPHMRGTTSKYGFCSGENLARTQKASVY